ncbi:SAM-dependent methyltransferase [Moraxella nasovis]|uniref:SAM-dependent methyltransferase n=1 Tax=Moraxella nasovis TaxID=2904121 RepID=UPI001F61FC40|nr:SAM-dependent methyltransferase [Moraxella nasovis]UNU73326.1 SAM-dependent methyltransferase [Moraxella nasovis]
MTDLSHRFARPFRPEVLISPKHIKLSPLDNRPLFFEIGAGKGKHALLFAHDNPNKQLLAVERTHEKITAFHKQLTNLACDNLYAIQADAIAFAVHYLPPNSLDGVFILYPNPEPHNKNQRWLNMPFFEFLISRMKAGAKLTLVSNIAWYIDEAEEKLNNTWLLPYDKHQVATDSARTHFEIKYLQRGETCTELNILKPNYYRTRFDDFCQDISQTLIKPAV